MINIYVFDLLWFPGGLKLNLIKSSGTNYNVKYTKKIHEVIYSFKKFNLDIENKISYRVNDAVTWCFFQEISKKKEKKVQNNFPIYIYIIHSYIILDHFQLHLTIQKQHKESTISIALEYPATKTDTWILDQTETLQGWRHCVK